MTRETWTFNLHWQNDEPLYRNVLAVAGDLLERVPDLTDQSLGLFVVAGVWHWADLGHSVAPWWVPAGPVDPGVLANLAADIGPNGWGEIDLEDVAVAVREALDLEAVQ